MSGLRTGHLILLCFFATLLSEATNGLPTQTAVGEATSVPACIPPNNTYNLNYSNWMATLSSHLYNFSLWQVTLPGTHDSGTYELYDEVGPGESETVDELIKLAVDFDLPIYPFIRSWGQAQIYTFYEQLNQGIRYLDLRACWYNNSWNTQHFLIGVPTQVLLNDIRKFLDEQPGEVVVVEVGDLDGSNYDQQLQLAEMIETTLGPYIFPASSYNTSVITTTIGDMVQSNQRCLVMFPASQEFEYAFPSLWSTNNWKEGYYANKDVLSDMESNDQELIQTLGGDYKLFEVSWTLTPQTNLIVESLLDPFFSVRTLYDLAMFADSNLDAFFKSSGMINLQPGNLLLTDHFQCTNIVDLCISINLRCHDVYSYIGRQPDGSDCRSRAQYGNCTAESTIPFMKANCPFTCGFC